MMWIVTTIHVLGIIAAVYAIRLAVRLHRERANRTKIHDRFMDAVFAGSGSESAVIAVKVSANSVMQAAMLASLESSEFVGGADQAAFADIVERVVGNRPATAELSFADARLILEAAIVWSAKQLDISSRIIAECEASDV